MKTFIKKVLIWLVFCLLITGAFPYFVDPYNVFHADEIRGNGVEPNRNYIKTTYILKNIDKYDAFMFGTSRVGAIHTDKIEDVHCYNMNYSAGMLSEHLANIETFLEAGVEIKRVYVGFDSLAYTDNVENHNGDAIRMSYEYIKANPEVFYKTYLDPLMTARSLSTIFRNGDGGIDKDIFYEYGWWCDYDQECGGSWTEDITPYIGSAENYMDNIPTQVEYIKAIKDLCDENDIEVIFFTSPMHEVTELASEERGYYDFLKAVAQVTDFYNFSGINDITKDVYNYTDNSHYNAVVGDLIMDAISGKGDKKLESQGFGVLVTKDNVDEVIEILKTNEL